MCGIAGIIGDHPEAEAAQAMADSLAHRGPDDHGIVVREHAAVAHTRLSLFDLSAAGHQPWTDGRYGLVYNGEIYNFQDERKRLENDGDSFVSASDTEVLFRSLVRYGVRATLDRIRGMFAFAFVDFESGDATLARDRYGIKPLYYAEAAGRTYFASEVKAIATVCPLDLDPIAALFAVTGQADQSGRRSLFRGVLQVPPGHLVEVRGGHALEATAYARLEDEVHESTYRELERASAAEVTERFDQLMQTSVERMLRSDAKVGVFVSGGVDSGLLAALAAGQRNVVDLYTADVVGRYSELEAARTLAASLGQQLHTTPFHPQDLLDKLALCTWHYETPLVKHPNAVPLAMVSADAKADGTKAVLTGEGADELFLGYPNLAAARLRPYVSAPFTALRWVYRQVPGLGDYVLKNSSEPTLSFLGVATQGYERQQLRSRGLEAYSFVDEEDRRLHHQTMMMMREHLLSLLHRNDRMGMMSGLEARFPFLDEDVVAFGLNLPTKFKIRRSRHLGDHRHPFLQDKFPIRSVAARYLPPEPARKAKAGFGVHGLGSVVLRPGALDHGYVAELLRLDSTSTAYLEGHGPRYELGKLFAVEVFARLFAERQSVDQVAGWVAEVSTLSAAATG